MKIIPETGDKFWVPNGQNAKAWLVRVHSVKPVGWSNSVFSCDVMNIGTTLGASNERFNVDASFYAIEADPRHGVLLVPTIHSAGGPWRNNA